MKQVYEKYHSFFGLRIKNKKESNNLLKNFKSILNEKKNLKKLSLNHIKILDNIKKDLFENGTKGRPKFSLNPHVIKEIQTLNSDQIPKYLVHRYRYEIIDGVVVFNPGECAGIMKGKNAIGIVNLKELSFERIFF